MNTPIQDTFKRPFQVTELDADNNPTGGNGDTCTVVSADTASVSVVLDPSPAPGTLASGFLVGGSKLQAGVAVTATPSHADGTPVAPPSTILIDVVASAAVSAGFTLGDQVPQ